MNCGNEEDVIEYPEDMYIFETDGKPTKVIDENKLTKRIVFGDDEYGRPEPDMFGRRAYNGKHIEGAIPKLKNGWLEKQKDIWSQSKNPRNMVLLDEIEHPGTHQFRLSEHQYPLTVYWRYFDEYYIPRAILNILILESFYEKFGVSHSVNDVSNGGKYAL